jgi:hypothetical protein
MLVHLKIDIPTEFHVHHELPHQETDAELKVVLEKITSSILSLKEILMATAAEFTAGFARIDAATTAIATLIRDLIAKQQAGNMTADEEAAAQAKLLQVADSLEAMASTPTDPVPVPVPTA